MTLALLATLACTKGTPGDSGLADNDLDGFPASEDCDDNDENVNPDAQDVCNGVDDDCDDQIDEGVQIDLYPDADGDGEGDAAASATPGCEESAGMVQDASDCDDGDPEVHTGASEVCNGLDDDCDGLLDEEDDSLDASTLNTFYEDGDADGYGNDAAQTKACSAPSGYVDNNEDCNDALDTISPDAEEVCNGLDDDCDSLVDGDDDSIDPGSVTEYYVDADLDGYGDESTTAYACELEEGLAEVAGDCDDSSGDVNPGADETCNEVDSDCDGDAWTGATDAWFHADGDGSWSEADVSAWTGTEAGTLYLCENTYDADLVLEADIDILGVGEELSVLDGAGARTILTIETASLTVDVSGVSFQNGNADYTDSNFGYQVGGAIACMESSVLTVSDASFLDNAAGLGGALTLDGCEVELDSVAVSGSSGTFGGAFFGFSGVLDLVDSEVHDNEATGSGGVYYGYNIASTNEANFLDCSVYDNSAAYYGGALMLDVSSEATCTGTAGTAGGFWDNASNTAGEGFGGGAVMVFASDATFEADVCDFGTVANDDDNDPNDILTDTGAWDSADTGDWGYDFDDDVSVSCTSAGCSN